MVQWSGGGSKTEGAETKGLEEGASCSFARPEDSCVQQRCPDLLQLAIRASDGGYARAGEIKDSTGTDVHWE